MILIIIGSLLVSFCSFTFISTITKEAVHNSFESLNYTLPPLWEVTDVIEPFYQPFYDSQLVEETTLKHFKDNLSHYLNDFKVGFYFFNSETLEESKDRYVTGVRISLNANIPFSKEYYRATTYEIKETAYVI